MKIELDADFMAHPVSPCILGVDGEKAARTMYFYGLGAIQSAEYEIQFLLPEGIRTGTIENGAYVIDPEIVAGYGTIPCQIIGRLDNIIIIKSNIFDLEVLPSLDSPVPTGEIGLKIKSCTLDEYKAMPVHSSNTFYLVNYGENFDLFLGDLHLKNYPQWYGTQEEYDAIDSPDPNTDYNIVEG
ncbi:MAG: hypothetical protein IJ740_13380 [Ruminococcus sp.]|nr:hypothetical protein [Ruminococcus sp.]